MAGGAPIGNKHAVKQNRLVTNVLRRMLVQNKNKDLFAICKTAIKKAKEGDAAMFKDITDRVDGKAIQAVELSGAGGGPIETKVDVTGELDFGVIQSKVK